MLAAWRRWWQVVLLGIATIGAYGTVYHAIGVLIPVIGGATGWARARWPAASRWVCWVKGRWR